MEKINDICKHEISDRIRRMKLLIDGAQEYLSDGDYLQCAIRIDQAAKLGNFDLFSIKIFDLAGGQRE